MKKKYFLKNKFDEFNTSILANQFLNVNNLENISKKKINSIEHRFEKKKFYLYKRSLLYKWDKEKNNYENLEYKAHRFKKYAKKLDIKLIDKDIHYIYNLESLHFTKTRNLKTIEVPYDIEKNELSPFAYFVFKNFSVYIQNNFFLKLLHKGQFYITKTEIVIYDFDQKEINFLLIKNNIDKILQEKHTIKIIDKDGNEFHLYSEKNNHAYIALKRLWKGKKENLFNN